MVHGTSILSGIFHSLESGDRRRVATGDLNGDEKSDLVFQHTDGTLAVWLMDGITLRSASLLNPNHPGDPNWRVVGTGDFNTDGQTDVVFQHADGSLAVWFMNGARLTQSALFSPRTPNEPKWHVVSTADRNQDGKPDLLFRTAETDLVSGS